MKGFTRKRFYIGRPLHIDTPTPSIEISTKKDGWDKYNGFDWFRGFLTCIEDKIWSRLTDAKVEPGKVRRIYITLVPATGREGKRLYLARGASKFSISPRYELGTTKRRIRNLIFPAKHFLLAFCARTFEEVTSIKMKPGEIVRVNLTIEIK